MFDYQGKIVMSKVITISKGSNLLTLNDLSKLSPSVYLMQLSFDNKIINQKIMIR